VPQYELDRTGAEAGALVRGRSPEDAVRRAAEVPDATAVEVDAPEGVEGWQAVRVGGEAAGRIRAHQRMRFRRD